MTVTDRGSSGPTYEVLPSGEPVGRARWQRDLVGFVTIVATTVLLGAPAGLLWSAVAPRYTVIRSDAGVDLPDIESTKAFIGADGSYVVVVLVLGLLCGALAWRFARGYGPWTVVGLVVGGLLAAWVAARVELIPGSDKAKAALGQDSPARGSIDLFLGVRDDHTGELSLRGSWGAVAWPVGALGVFLVFAFQRPEELD